MVKTFHRANLYTTRFDTHRWRYIIMDASMPEEYSHDDWPKMPDGNDFDGTQLLQLFRSNKSPFQRDWDVDLLIQEIEHNLNTQIVDIPFVSKGSNNYGFHFKLSNRPDIIARVARGDVNIPGFDGFPFQRQVPEVRFEAATYELLRSEPDLLTARLLYHRVPVQYPEPRLQRPTDITGRRVYFFERAEGRNNVWKTLNPEGQVSKPFQARSVR